MGETNDDVIKWETGDVKDAGRLSTVLKGASAVLFTASASQGEDLTTRLPSCCSPCVAIDAISITQQGGSVTSHAIVRPGGLSDKTAPKGLQDIQISQGDTVGGVITQDDTALVTAQALLHPTAKNTVFEVVWHKEEEKGEGEGKQQAPPMRHQGWTDFFSRLRPNNGAHDPAFYP